MNIIKKVVVCFLICFFLKEMFTTNQKYDYFVSEGKGINSIATDLENNNIINSALVFKAYSKVRSLFLNCNIVEIGEYKIENNESYESLLKKFCNGNTIIKTLTIPEGLETREIIDILNNSKDLTGDKIIFSDEGRLLPETYSFKSGVKREVIFEKMQKDLVNFIAYEWQFRKKNDVIKTPKDAIILASIVEKEAKTDEERPIIASVYVNRLLLGMKLEADPTTIYEITKGKYKLPRLLTRNDIRITGKYNTYYKKGLPIAPICNPGKKSILAALHPDETEYLYFVAKADLSGHIFAKNYNDHLKNIKQVRSKNSARGRIRK